MRQDAGELTVGDAPQLHRPVDAGRGEKSTVGAEGDLSKSVCVADKGSMETRGLGIPQRGDAQRKNK